MCQMSLYVKEGVKEELFKENITRLETLPEGIRVSTLFEGPTELSDMIIHHIDFTAGKVVLERQMP